MFANLPLELQQLHQWLVWRYEQAASRKPTKVPYNPKSGWPASVTDPQTWVTFAEAVAAATDGSGRYAGIGFVFTDRDDYSGIDLDTHVDPETGESLLSPEDGARQQLIFQKMDSYSERSPSGRGLHIIVKAKVPHGRKRANIEVYSANRFFTMTGDVYHSAPIADRQELVQMLWAELGNQPQSNPHAGEYTEKNTDEELWRMASDARNGELFSRLWNGDTGGYPSASEADLALVNIIAFYTKHRLQIQRMFLASALGRRDKYANAKPGRQSSLIGYMIDKAFDRVLPPVDLSGVAAQLNPISGEAVQPIDLWASFEPPTLPHNLLPDQIEQFARVLSFHMGADAGGLAVAAIATCAGSIPDHVRIQVKRNDASWTESPRIWPALIGTPSTKKTPIISEASRPLAKIDGAMVRSYMQAKARYDGLAGEAKRSATPPLQLRHILNDTTMEAAQEVLRDCPCGVLLVQDELSGWFGSMDKYAGGRGAAKDRGFWLQAYNGGPYAVNRIQRGAFLIDNLSVSMIGGIQPEAIRKIAADTVDDGLLQRLTPVMLQPATTGRDEPKPEVAADYAALIARLTKLGSTVLQFDDEAQAVRSSLETHHVNLMAIEAVNPKLAAHIGKYDGVFARLCVIWHCVQYAHVEHLPLQVSGSTARKVADFMHG